MKKSKVALVKCESYDENEVYSAVEKGVGFLGGISEFVKPSEKIVIKPNMLVGTDPDKCVTPYPSVFKALGRLIKQIDVDLYYGDSPGFGKSEKNMEKAGLKQVADKLGIKLADFDNGRTVSHKDALVNKKFVIANGVLDSDGIISLSKLKTHQLTRLTGAVKNQFGCIPGMLKGEYHVKMADAYHFSTMLVDLNTFIKPRLYIMDGIIAMEGNGPRSGKPKKMNSLLFSTDPIALDSVACKLVDINPEYITTSKIGEEAGLGTYRYENIEMLGDNVDLLIDKSFDIVRRPVRSSTGGRFITFLKNRLSSKPVIDEDNCTVCGTCVKMCPVNPKAVDWHSGNKSEVPTYLYDRCIRCYCCQELCPEGVITAKSPLLGRLLLR